MFKISRRVFLLIRRFSALPFRPTAASKKWTSSGVNEGCRLGRNRTTSRARFSVGASAYSAMPESTEDPTLQSLTRSAYRSVAFASARSSRRSSAPGESCPAAEPMVKWIPPLVFVVTLPMGLLE
jgi:hypothetical protein